MPHSTATILITFFLFINGILLLAILQAACAFPFAEAIQSGNTKVYAAPSWRLSSMVPLQLLVRLPHAAS